MKALKLVTCSEAAKLLDLTPSAIRAMEARGKIKALRTETGVRLFKKSAVEALARERARKRQPHEESARL